MMGLRRQLQELEDEHSSEVKNLHDAFCRTKRNLAPAQLVRAHPITAMSVAAAVGYMIVPRRSPRFIVVRDAQTKNVPSQPHEHSWFFEALAKVFPGAEKWLAPLTKNGHSPESPPEKPIPDQHPQGRIDRMLKMVVIEALTLLLSKVDVMQVIRAWIEGVTGKPAAHPAESGPHADGPTDGRWRQENAPHN